MMIAIFLLLGFTEIGLLAQEKEIYKILSTKWHYIESKIHSSKIPNKGRDYYCIGACRKKSATGKGYNRTWLLEGSYPSQLEKVLDLGSRWSFSLKTLDNHNEIFLIRASKKVDPMSWSRGRTYENLYYLCRYLTYKEELKDYILEEL